MTHNFRTLRAALLTGASTAFITGLAASPAFAEPAAVQSGTNTITVQQEFNDYTAPAVTQTLDGNTDGTISTTINSGDPANYALQNGTVTVGSSATTGNRASATGYANSADLTVTADFNNVTGSGYSSSTSLSTGAAMGASVNQATDVGVALSQQNTDTDAVVSNGTDLGVSLDYGATDSTVTIAGNRQTATGVLNSGTNLLDATANSSSASSAIGLSQSSVNADLSVSVAATAQFSSEAGASGIGLNDSTVSLSDNAQAATAVANSGSNTQTVSANALTLSDTTGAATAPTVGVASAGAAYVTAANQEVSGAVGTSIGATISNSPGFGGFRNAVDGDVVGSTLNADRNSASVLARGNELVNSTALDANSIVTGSLALPDHGTVSAIASQQAVTGTVAINASVDGSGADGPMVTTIITGDVGADSAVSASGNTVLANAAGNRGSSAISASATTIDTAGAIDANGNAGAGFADGEAGFVVANGQSISAATTITAGLVDSIATPTAGTSIGTDIGGSVVASNVASSDNTLSASVAGNQSLTGGNAITLSGTNVATTAVVSSAQQMGGILRATVGSEGSAPVSAGTQNFTFTGTSIGTPGDYVFTGSAAGTAADAVALQAQYPTLSFTHDAGVIQLIAPNQLTATTSFGAGYATGGSAGLPASGGVVVAIGNDITNSSVAVNGNATSGSATGNSVTNRVAADATTLASGSAPAQATGLVLGGNAVANANADMAVANAQVVASTASLEATVGAVFGITAEGITTPTLSDVAASTLSVSDNTQSALVKGNEGSNAVQLTATNLSTTSGIASSQTMDGDLSATIADFSGAFVTVGRDITGSTIVVDGNAISGTTVGNDVTNAVAVTGSSTIAQGDSALGAIADPSTLLDDDIQAIADQTLVNLQAIGSTGSLTTSVEAGYGIVTLGVGASANAPETSDVASSSLSVSGNVQSASSTGNNAANGVSISGGSLATDGALMSVQTADTTQVLADSVMTVAAPAASTVSTLSLNGNANSASATVNAATNSMTVAASTTLAGASGDAVLSGALSADYVADADFVVNNAQTVDGGSVGAFTSTNIWNNDGASGVGSFPTNGVQQSTVDVIGNVAQSTATSNRSTNSLALSANSSGASGGVLNQQASAAAVSSVADAIIGIDVAGYALGDAETPMNGSALNIGSNAVSARAGGNTTTNTLSAAATTFTNAAVLANTALTANRTDVVNASFAVLNEQTNSGPISATADVVYGTTFDSVGEAPTVADSSVLVGGNSASALGYGNAATNQMTFAALNGTGRTTLAIGSNQLNTGNVSAFSAASIGTVATGDGTGTGGAVTMSNVAITGNSVSASAFGNSSSNSLTVSGNNVNVTR